MSDLANLDAVLGLAAMGWRIFPVESRGKAPLVKDWPHVATTDPQQIRTWGAKHPDSNWGVACGAATGAWVLDVDGEHGAASLRDLCAQHGDGWTHTLTVVTARGFHFYFRWPEGAVTIRNSAGKIGSGLDVRALGGYVLVPPSVHPSGAVYRWQDDSAGIKCAPEWLLGKITSPEPRVPIAAGEIGILPQGIRNDGLIRFAGALRCKGKSQAEIEAALFAANERRCRPPLPEAEVRAIAVSVCRYPSGGPDPLETAWQATQSEVHPSRYARFLALCRYLQGARPGFPIALPLQRIGTLMACDWTQVRRWRRRAVNEGRLRPAERYIPHRRAGQYSYSQCPTREAEERCTTRADVPLGTSVPLKKPTIGLVGQSEESPSGTVDNKGSGGYVGFHL